MATDPFVKVKEAMKTPVVTVGKNEKIDKVAKLMEKHGIGSVVVLDAKKKPVGIITERDIVIRVFARKVSPSKLKAADIMSAPLATISPDTGMNEAARSMNRLGVRRLAVMEGDKLVGIVSSRDIVEVTPALIEIITEKARLGMRVTARELSPLAGHCDACGQWSETLKEVEGKFLCDDCATETSNI